VNQSNNPNSNNIGAESRDYSKEMHSGYTKIQQPLMHENLQIQNKVYFISRMNSINFPR